MHIVSMKQKDEIIRFYSVSDKELMVDFPDKETAKHEIVDIIRTLNRHVSPPGSP
jgi:ATP-dependent RNA circularization protein (DNA/RNA ligase family)